VVWRATERDADIAAGLKRAKKKKRNKYLTSEHDIDRSETGRGGLLSVEHGTNAIAVAV